ncbi:hypothetical protein R3W88_011480 [Solanum pinnatisectum]|uniref:Endonuclease/exonuclease/phosphatase domain-containing protein n=1 Tax=Solanum pinnatisectum TaxID=50273 RepID=A0AAV9L7E9_9SOLN|nr:hypothetical protein R3W88_011480 [Solanum pinnatisectum]
MDSIFCWNVRGLNAPNKQKEVILPCNKESTGLVSLLDTNEEEVRKNLWSYLESVSSRCNSPWLVMGDFNTVLNMDDRIGGNPVNLAEVVDFQECVHSCGWLELPHQGRRYTWNDKGDVRVYSKIDWTRVNEGWLKQFPGCTLFKVVKKLKCLKKSLKQLNGQHFRNILTEADEDRDRLKQVQKTLQSSPTDLILQQQERELHKKFRRSSYLAEVFLEQRSKASWIKLGDDNTSYLYSIIKHKKLQDGVTQLKNSQDVLQTDYKMIAEFFVDYYQDMLGKERSCRTRAYPNVLRNGPKLSIDQ